MLLVMCNKTKETFIMGARENKFQRLHILPNEILRMQFYVCFLNSCEI